MVNRLKERLGEPEEEYPAGDYYEILAHNEVFYVSREVAEAVLRLLNRRWPARWIGFTTLSGSAVRIRSRLIQCVQECTGPQRSAAREFHRAQRKESKADRRPWEDDDWF